MLPDTNAIYSYLISNSVSDSYDTSAWNLRLLNAWLSELYSILPSSILSINSSGLILWSASSNIHLVEANLALVTTNLSHGLCMISDFSIPNSTNKPFLLDCLCTILCITTLASLLDILDNINSMTSVSSNVLIECFRNNCCTYV